MSGSIPSSPVPSNSQVNTSENTRLLNTNTASYNARETNTTKQTVITMSSDEVVTTTGLIHGGGLSITTLQEYEDVIRAGQPTIPTQQLTEKIQDILVFTEIKVNQQERAIQEEKKRKIKDRQQIQYDQYQKYYQEYQQQKQELENQNQQHMQPPEFKQTAPLPYQIENLNKQDSSSSSDSDSDDDSVRFALKRKLTDWSIDHDKKKDADGKKSFRKRDYAVDALKFATSNWKEKHGWATGSNNNSSASLFPVATSPSPGPNTVTTTTTTTTATPTNHGYQNGNGGATVVQQVKKQAEKHFKPIPSTAESVFEVAKNASVCAVLALLHERRQSSGFSTETDISLQALALSTLTFGLKVQDKSASHVVLYEMLTTKWMNGKSALEWAVENNSDVLLSDARVQLVIEDLWKSGPNWRQDPNHPSNIWLKYPAVNGVLPPKQEEPKNFGWYVICHTFADFMARWASVRYQTLLGFFIMLSYLILHLFTVTNQEYTSDTPFAYEYAYFVFVTFDLLLEYYKLLSQPSTYLRKVSSYVSLLTVSLLASAVIIRVFALVVVYDIEVEAFFLILSYALVILATPLMFFRLFVSASDLCWGLAKVNYILHQCFVNSLWIFGLGLFVLLGFWVALAALQFDDISPITMLRYLVFGALHAPSIGSTISYQNIIGAILLAVYLFLTVIVLGSLLTASFLSTFLDIHGRIDTIKRDWVVSRCLTVAPALGVFIPSVPVDLFFGIINWIVRVVFKRQTCNLWVEKTHQVLWYICYSPIILLVGLYELTVTVLFKWTLVANAFKRKPTTASA
ncbi:hypothetical protein EDC94DRAFT_699923 [Helicostylum pulchrum]|nr:hypothetical protein EDC94DRAFT_699923 [Helicostylum pulchrum]